MVKISIIIPCYNVENYIQRNIDSLKRQSNKELEFIFVNDGSTDRTLDYISDFARTDSRVRIINKKNEGVSSARNDALEVASGEYIFFLDGDDFLEDEACTEMYSLIKRSEADCLIFSKHRYVYSVNEQIVYNWPFAEGVYESTYLLKKAAFLPITPKLYKNQVIKKYKIAFDEDLIFGEVFTFFIRFLKCARKIAVTNSFVYNYVMRHDSTTHLVDFTKDLEILKTLYRLDVYVSNFPFIDRARCYNRSVIKLVYSFTFAKYVKNGICNKSAISVLSKLKKNVAFRSRLYDVAFHNFGTKDQIISFLFLFSSRLSLFFFSTFYRFKSC